MDREILFRAKTKTNKWVFGNYYICDRQPAIQMNFLRYFIKPKTLGQYTGLKDKNGTKIFEGDIIKFTRTNMYAPSASFHNQDLISLHTIFWNDEKHCFYQNHINIEEKRIIGAGRLCFEDERANENIIEVIGNVFDNPEILEKVEE